MSAQPPGLRERKKQQTRQLIADTARRLFAQRGFEAVTVAEVARAADVAEKTVFNYFPTKEDLVYWRLEAFEGELLAAIRERAPGEPFITGFERFVRRPRGLLAGRQVSEDLLAVTRMIAASPALLAREQQVFARYTQSLAALIAEQTGAAADDVEPWVAANALMGVHRALVEYARRAILEGAGGPGLARAVEAQAARAIARLQDGLGTYGA
jgi:AcrR family transcriptional regulator